MSADTVATGLKSVSWAVLTLAGWTVLLWMSRLRNVLGNDELTALGRQWRIGVVIVFVVLGIATLAESLRSQRSIWRSILVGWTVLFWIVRWGGIVVGDWSFGFKAVHTVLALVSFGLCAWVVRDLRATRWRSATR